MILHGVKPLDDSLVRAANMEVFSRELDVFRSELEFFDSVVGAGLPVSVLEDHRSEEQYAKFYKAEAIYIGDEKYRYDLLAIDVYGANMELNAQAWLEDGSLPNLAALASREALRLIGVLMGMVDYVPPSFPVSQQEADRYLARVADLFERKGPVLSEKKWTYAYYQGFEKRHCPNTLRDLILFRMNFLQQMKQLYGIQ